jgi:integrase
MRYAAPLEASEHSVYSNPQIEAEVLAAIHVYKPKKMARHLWSDEMAEFTRAAVTDFGPSNGTEASAYMRCLGRLVINVVKVQCEPLERRVVFDGVTIDLFYKNALSKKAGGRTDRLRLFRLAAELHEFDPDRRDAGPRYSPRTRAPYRSPEIVRLLSQGRTRSTALRRHNWQMLVALGAGCGLTSEEVVFLKRDDIRINPDYIEVRIRGNRARSVICIAEWEHRVASLLCSDLIVDYVIVSRNRPKVPATWIAQTVGAMASWDTRFSMERLRSTFIVRHLEVGTSSVHLLRMLGVRQFSTIERLIPYINVPSVIELAALLRIPKGTE